MGNEENSNNWNVPSLFTFNPVLLSEFLIIKISSTLLLWFTSNLATGDWVPIPKFKSSKYNSGLPLTVCCVPVAVIT